jgi:glycosyltransferase involved in cell wall biosynthesis
MRVLVILPDAFGGHGGIALYNRDLITALCAHPACEEVVAIPRLMPHPCEPFPDKLTYVTDGVDGKFRFVATVFRAVWKNPRFDLIICGHINLLPIAYAVQRWVSAPLLLEIYGIDAWKPTGSTLSNYLSRKVDAFISISEVTRRYFLEWSAVPGSKGFILSNAIHAERYGPGPKSQELLDRYGLRGKVVLMTLGRLASFERYKGFDEVLEMLPDLVKEIPGITYLIVGDGTDRPRLETKATSLGVADRVVFTGFIPEAEKADHYRLADVYVMPSSGEGFGFVFLEAMACGVPAIGSRTDGGREALRDGELGFVVDPTNREEIQGAIRKALNDRRGSVPQGLEHFSYENFTRRLHAVIGNLLGSPGPTFTPSSGSDFTLRESAGRHILLRVSKWFRGHSTIHRRSSGSHFY